MPKMNWKSYLTYCGIVFLFPILSVKAEGFERGKLIFYGNGAFGIGENSGTLEKNVEKTNFPNFLALNSPYADNLSAYMNYYTISTVNQQRTELSSHFGELGFEYGLFRYFGIGLSVSDQVIRASNFRSVDERQIILYALTATNYSTLLSRLNQGDIYDLAVQKKRDVFHSTSGDLNLFFHLQPNDPMDPYIRVGGGAGYERLFGGGTNRVFGAVGFRYHFDSHLFVNAELEHSNVYIVNYSAPSSGHRNKGNFEETFYKIGLGVSFSTLGDVKQEIETKPTSVLDTAGSELPTQSKEQVIENKLERFVFLASEIFDLPTSRIHLEGRARLDAIARSLVNEYKDYDVLVITYTSPFRDDLPGNYENYDLGFERSQAISRILRDKGVSPQRIINSTQGSSLYTVESKEKVVIELRKKVK
ncbi:hypothetical protein EHQ23_11340 [Leptospira bourretii]|uniref:OmpA-like domain-containing protein n=1 Tax=Leptospira bourretii TaxID=2484962 RepID=A0A4R9INF0_9LEPT|nr:hypothetical protein EHQ23_11340 [Leptospira bourretii]TGK91011.1 hypothetical protein EHQ26_12945 [Leptospira bourretii]TGL17728.1 hypothetical protein EHQ47_18500 [Leptospira bourretii]TGL41224.1 hypothetical protein EHQ45_03075 [Leptospira bourretii]